MNQPRSATTVSESLASGPLAPVPLSERSPTRTAALRLHELATIPKIKDIAVLAVLGDLVTRFSGIVMCCVVTGIIWTVLKPESLLNFILTDYMHFSLWAGGLYFGLRGNWAVAIDKKP